MILIQEMLYDKYSKSRARHFRLISSFDGEVVFCMNYLPMIVYVQMLMELM